MIRTKDGFVTEAFLRQGGEPKRDSGRGGRGGKRGGIARGDDHRQQQQQQQRDRRVDRRPARQHQEEEEEYEDEYNYAEQEQKPRREYRKQEPATEEEEDSDALVLTTAQHTRKPSSRPVTASASAHAPSKTFASSSSLYQELPKAAPVRACVTTGNDNYLTDCVFFLQGRCTKGDKCEFRHSEAAKSNTKVCKFWASGSCRVLECMFRHPSKTAPGAAPTQAAFRPKPAVNRSAVPCHFYAIGTCTKGDACPFLHEGEPGHQLGLAGLDAAQAAAAVSPSARKATLTTKQSLTEDTKKLSPEQEKSSTVIPSSYAEDDDDDLPDFEETTPQPEPPKPQAKTVGVKRARPSEDVGSSPQATSVSISPATSAKKQKVEAPAAPPAVPAVKFTTSGVDLEELDKDLDDIDALINS